MAIKVYKISFNNFKKYSKKAKNNPLKIKSLIYKILDSFSKQKKYAISSIFKTNKIDKKIDYLNKNKAAWYLNGDIKLELSFNELYEKAMYESLNIINEINEQIFYKKKPKNIVATLLNNITKIQ